MTFDQFLKALVSIGIPTILGAAIYIGRKLQTVDDLKSNVYELSAKTTKVSELLNYIKGKIETRWREKLAPSHSPMKLNEEGNKILNNSGVKEIIKQRLEEFYDDIKNKNPRNAYWIQEFSIKEIYKLRKDEKLLPKLENAAFESGVDIDAVLFVGGIYLRDLVLPKFDYTADDIDKCKESEK